MNTNYETHDILKEEEDTLATKTLFKEFEHDLGRPLDEVEKELIRKGWGVVDP